MINSHHSSPARITGSETFPEEATKALREKVRAARRGSGYLIGLKRTLAVRTAQLAKATAKLQFTIEHRLMAEDALHTNSQRIRSLLRESRRKNSSLRMLARHALVAREKQRHEISHDLQDDVAQTLLGINVQLLLLSTKSGIDRQGLVQNIALTQQLVDDSAKSVRVVTRRIKPSR